jgi:hypothetical protein
MVLALAAFGWMWRQTHRAPAAVNAPPVHLVGAQGTR